RAELEGLAAQLAADLATQAQIDALRQTIEHFRAAVVLVEQKAEEGHTEWSAANDAFHELVIEASCNRRLGDTIRSLHRINARNPTWRALEGDVRLLRANVDQHEAVCAAIGAGDGEAARAAMIAHVRRSGDLITARAQL